MPRDSGHHYCYSFYGVAYLREALNSIGSLRTSDPKAIIHVVAPSEFQSHLQSICDYFIPLNPSEVNSGFLFKINGIKLVSSFLSFPFVFLDTDTVISKGIVGLFSLPEWIDIGGVQDPLGNSFDAINDLIMPQSWLNYKSVFTELNTGVIYICHRNRTELIEKWSSRHSELIFHNSHKTLMSVPDQPSLLQALLDLQLNIHYLPPRFNVRVCYPQVFIGPIAVIHSHSTHAFVTSYSNLDQKVLYQTFPFGIAFSSKSFWYKIVYQCFLRLKLLSTTILMRFAG